MDRELKPVPVEAIAVYPDAFGKGAARCVQVAQGPITDRYDELQAYITATAADPARVEQCKCSETCGYLLAGLKEDPAFASWSHPVKVAKVGDRYFPNGGGHHRICIAKRAGLPMIMARVHELPADDPRYTFMDPVGEIGTHTAQLRMRYDRPWSGSALYVTETEDALSYAWKPATYLDTEPRIDKGDWCRPWPDRPHGRRSLPAPLLIRAHRARRQWLGFLPGPDVLTTEVQLQPPTGRILAVAEVFWADGGQVDIRVIYRSAGWTQHHWSRLEPPDRLQPWLHAAKA